MPYADIRGLVKSTATPYLSLRQSAVIYLVCSTANLSAWRHLILPCEVGKLLLSRHYRVINTAGAPVLSANYPIPASAPIWPCGRAVQRAGLDAPLGESSAPEKRVGPKTYCKGRKETSRPDSSYPGPCVWRLTTFVAGSVAARHSTYDTSFSCGPSVRQFQRNQIKSWMFAGFSRMTGDFSAPGMSTEECYKVKHAAS